MESELKFSETHSDTDFYHCLETGGPAEHEKLSEPWTFQVIPEATKTMFTANVCMYALGQVEFLLRRSQGLSKRYADLFAACTVHWGSGNFACQAQIPVSRLG